MIARQLALTLDEIAQVRRLHRELERSLLVTECYIDTGLLQGPDPGERARLHAQLLTIATERRRLAMTKNDQLRALHQRLLELLNKQVYLGPDDEN
jgi:hypothetical protein